MKMKLITETKTYDLNRRTHVMGILNITPDSFSDGGSYTEVEKAVDQAVKMEQLGADIIDIGGESTRPGHRALSIDEELQRILPVIEAVRKKVKIPISVDTYKAKTAEHAIRAGADIINDVWGAKKDPEIAEIAAKYNVPIILMHNRENKNYTNLIEDMKHDLQESIDIALRAGVKQENIILDPGIGFAKSLEDNYTVLNHLEEFTSLGYPVLLATSRKSFISKIVDVPPEERDNATGATTCLGITKGVQMIRVHNVALHVELTKMMDAMLRGVGLDG